MDRSPAYRMPCFATNNMAGGVRVSAQPIRANRSPAMER
jgi:hypothetical protein